MVLARSAEAASYRSLGGGGWSWFGDPRAVHHKRTHSRTYIGWIDREGTIRVASYDHGTRVRTTAVLRWRLGIDDHNNPSLHVLPDGRLMVFYSRASRKRMSYRVSRRPEDIRSWGRERTLRTNTSGPKGYTYPNPVQLRAERIGSGSSGEGEAGSRPSRHRLTAGMPGRPHERSSGIRASAPTSSFRRTRRTRFTSH